MRRTRTIRLSSIVVFGEIIQACYSIAVIETIIPATEPGTPGDGPSVPLPGTQAQPSLTATASGDATVDMEPVDRQAAITEIATSLAEIARFHSCQAARRLTHDGISIAHLEILWLLEDRDAMSMGRVADMLGVALANATGLIDRMEQRGLVVRDRDDDDRRIVLVRATAAGKATLAEVDGWRSGMAADLLGRLDTDQITRILTGIREMRGALAASAVRPGCTGATRAGALAGTAAALSGPSATGPAQPPGSR